MPLLREAFVESIRPFLLVLPAELPAEYVGRIRLVLPAVRAGRRVEPEELAAAGHLIPEGVDEGDDLELVLTIDLGLGPCTFESLERLLAAQVDDLEAYHTAVRVLLLPEESGE